MRSTSAPWPASQRVAAGPARMRVRSSTRSPRSGPRLGFFSRLLDDVPAGERYRLVAEQIAHAEAQGFDSAWVAQHQSASGPAASATACSSRWVCAQNSWCSTST